MSGSPYISDILRAQTDDLIQWGLYFLKWIKSYFIDLSQI